MSHIPYTLYRAGKYYYNRRVPSHAVKTYGPFIRHFLTQDRKELAVMVDRLNTVLEKSLCSKCNNVRVNIPALVENFRPRPTYLSQAAEEYLALKTINQKPFVNAISCFIKLVGDRDISSYCREDAKVFIRHLHSKGNKTATIRRRINSLCAVFNFTYAEFDIDKRNPFMKLLIKGEGEDSKQRKSFSHSQLISGYEIAFVSKSKVKILMPILGETGCRLAEIIGLRVADIDLEKSLLHIRPNLVRKLKTKSSERIIPLTDNARFALLKVLKCTDASWVFPQYIRGGSCYATHASNALNKWLKNEFEGLTAHSLRHTFRDRLREVQCPTEIVDQLGGWSSMSSEGIKYGSGYSIKVLRIWMKKLEFSAPAVVSKIG